MTGMIIRLNRRHTNLLADIDFESEHQLDRERDSTKAEMQKSIIMRFKRGHELWFGYKEGGMLLGYATIKPFFPGHKHCELYWLAVRKSHQGKGIGSRLLRYVEDAARAKGFRRVCLYTGKVMKATRLFYEKNGYRLINEFPRFYGFNLGDTTSLLYAKDLR